MGTSPPATPGSYPIRQIVTDDLARNRATVFFRIILAIPHLIWIALWGVAAFVVLVINWFATLIAGQSPDWAHQFLSAYTRYTAQLTSYLYFAADPYPGFLGGPGYPLDLEIDPPAPQRRVITLFRVILVIPMAIVSGVFQYVQVAVAFVSWFYILFTGRMHPGMRNIIAFCIALNARVNGYILLLTDRYPTFSENEFPTS